MPTNANKCSQVPKGGKPPLQFSMAHHFSTHASIC
jgi:hypothetical protein